MAVPTGSGTETLHSHMFEDYDASGNLIVGVQHHVYTVLSIIVHCHALNATTDNFYVALTAYDNHGGAAGESIELFKCGNIQPKDTFVWNDKFSFNGYGPSGTDVFSTAAHQTANAAQGGASQVLKCSQDSSADGFDCIVTYLDQDWS